MERPGRRLPRAAPPGGLCRPGGEAAQRLAPVFDLGHDLRPAYAVQRAGGAKLVERNRLQRIDAVEKEDPHGGDVGGNVGDSLEQLEPRPLAVRRDLAAQEGAGVA